jgi:hypothetical protein
VEIITGTVSNNYRRAVEIITVHLGYFASTPAVLCFATGVIAPQGYFVCHWGDCFATGVIPGRVPWGWTLIRLFSLMPDACIEHSFVSKLVTEKWRIQLTTLNLLQFIAYLLFPNQCRNPGPNLNLTLDPNPIPNPDPNYNPNPNQLFIYFVLFSSQWIYWLGKKNCIPGILI